MSSTRALGWCLHGQSQVQVVRGLQQLAPSLLSFCCKTVEEIHDCAACLVSDAWVANPSFMSRGVCLQGMSVTVAFNIVVVERKASVGPRQTSGLHKRIS